MERDATAQTNGAPRIAAVGAIEPAQVDAIAGRVEMVRAAGAPEAEVFRLVPLPFNKRADFLASARRSDALGLANRIARIARADVAIKTSLGGGGERGARLQLEMLVCELAS